MSLRLGAVASITALAMLATTAVVAAGPQTKLVNQGGGSQTSLGAETGDINNDGRLIVFQTEDDSLSVKGSNFESDIYLRNVAGGSTAIMSVTSSGANGSNDSWDPVISSSGRIVAWDAEAPGLLDGKPVGYWAVYFRDRKTGKTKLASVNSAEKPANDAAFDPHLSASGRYIVFDTDATNMTSKNTFGHEQIYLRDRVKGKTYLISRNNAGKAGNGDSYDAAVSASGRFVVYTSTADNLSKLNDKGYEQIYRHDRRTGKTILLSRRKGKAGNGDSDDPEITANGTVVFESEASNLGFDSNGVDDIYMWKSGTLRRISKSWNGKQQKGGTDGETDALSGAFLSVDSSQTATLYRQLKRTPRVASVAVGFQNVYLKLLLKRKSM